MGRPPKLEIEKHPHLREFLDFLPEANAESDRGLVVICASYIDELLGRTLLSYVVDERKYISLVDDGGLSTFSSRIDGCAAFALILEKEAAECHRIRRIRNRFSHETQVSFDDQQVKDLCRNMTGRVAIDDIPARDMFHTAAVGLILSLVNRPAYVARERLQPRLWQR